jgi:hypothetical protein
MEPSGRVKSPAEAAPNTPGRLLPVMERCPLLEWLSVGSFASKNRSMPPRTLLPLPCLSRPTIRLNHAVGVKGGQ